MDVATDVATAKSGHGRGFLGLSLRDDAGGSKTQVSLSGAGLSFVSPSMKGGNVRS
jgi:hypothetical protein